MNIATIFIILNHTQAVSENPRPNSFGINSNQCGELYGTLKLSYQKNFRVLQYSNLALG